jgi:catechol 2,3-dioxygenase-like lactoylglutathione lyase family enzyme
MLWLIGQLNAGMEVAETRLVLTVSNFEAAVAFYRDALGLTPLAAWSSEGHVLLLGAGRATIELIDERHAEAIDAIEVGRRVAPRVRLAFQVADSATKGRDLQLAGAALVAPQVITPWGDANVRLDAADGTQLTLFTVPDVASK